MSPGMIGLEGSEILITHLRKEARRGKVTCPPLAGPATGLRSNNWGNVHWPTGAENPADGPAKVKSNMAPHYTRNNRLHSVKARPPHCEKYRSQDVRVGIMYVHPSLEYTHCLFRLCVLTRSRIPPLP